ncbi:hypothetical protein SAMN05216489_07295 [Streptomyces sp. 3213]|nr:hypothetical protein SAMN05216489_07295 [Streptomyces sp. 3213] [Streptomyces sp. 3213.3]
MRRITGPAVRMNALAITAAAVLVGGCSNNADDGDSRGQDTGALAGKVCDGTLDTAASAALRRLAGSDRFDELTGTNEAGEPNSFSLARAVKHLHDEYTKRSACRLYKSGDNSGQSLLEVRFSASSNHPSVSTEASSSDRVSYPLGVYALAGSNGADLFFRCPTKATTDNASVGDTNYVKAEMSAIAVTMRGNSVNKDRMVVLNSMARAIAEAAGCASTAALPTRVPTANGN